MKVEEFGFGIPPRVATLFRDKKGTDYTFNLLPIGGFVRILGEDPTGEDAGKKWSFMSKRLPSRLLVLVAGVTMNFLLAFVIFTGLFWYGTAPVTVSPFADGPTKSFFLPSFEEAEAMGFVTYSGIVLTPLTGSIAEKAGIQAGDILLSIDGETYVDSKNVVTKISKWQPMKMLLSQSGSIIELSLVPENGKVGMYIGYNELDLNKDLVIQKKGIEGIVAGAKETYYSSVLTLDFLGKVLKNLIAPSTPMEREEAKEMLSGPIGAGQLFVGLVEISAPLTIILLIIALLSINLGVVNLLPFPALDGGRIVTTVLYSIFSFFPSSHGRFVKFEKYLHSIGFLLLLALMIYVAGLDIGRIF